MGPRMPRGAEGRARVRAGAVQTIITLLRKPDNRCAAVTMLGKTVEMCYMQARPAMRPPAPLLRRPALRARARPGCARWAQPWT